jgi:DNA-binding transcriptional LysR family regulator
MHAPSTSTLSHLKLRHLLLITLLVEHGTLHKAARALNLSQPAATAMLSDLETAVGIRLFDRSHRGVRPTEHCLRLLDRVQTLLNDFQDFAETVHRLAAGSEPILRLGVVPQAFATYLPRAIERFRDCGGCSVGTREGTARQLLELLWQGHLDGIIGRVPSTGLPEAIDPSLLRLENLYTEAISIVCGTGRPDRQEMPRDLSDLGRCEWVLQRRDSSVRQALNAAFIRHGLQPPIPIVETTNYMQSLTLVAGSNYYTVAPRRPALLQQANGGLQVLDLDIDLPPMQVSFISRRASDGNTQLLRFRECFQAVAAEDGGGDHPA